MMKKLFLIIGLILIIGFIGASYTWLKLNSGTGDEIKIGKIVFDYAELENLQKEVDKGHQPWRLDPLLVAKTELPQSGFTSQDIQTTEFPSYEEKDLGLGLTSLVFELAHKGRMYSVTIGQPISGIGKIWAITEIQRK
ncbi:MAG: hypothetical protein UX31_C0030G0008 [Candidatus Nomurabacteria bacterium GW2011_GWA1_46_11]|uniref:Uncharacterized protein n=1 Tax=Candidatus Nomurabacteria bacterium GW2011_GWA1_46_11 TaxID=1618732 RepID=A0A0G1RII8_9BACT|nr:MAG: hypothetical protein UX31_C0030G0008 [Candidatus Nomurabacteria bacterium GW2011_GWA1_46_11]